MPQFVRRSVGNFYNNFSDAWSAINNILQGKVQAGLEDVTRVSTNTAVRPVRHARRRLRNGPRPSLRGLRADDGSLRHRRRRLHGAADPRAVDGARRGRAPASIATPPRRPSSTAPARRSGSRSCRSLNTRSGLLGATRVIDDIALDKYTFVRDAYLQRRRSLVFDGNAPETPEEPEAGRVRGRRRRGRYRGAAGFGAAGLGAGARRIRPGTLSDPPAARAREMMHPAAISQCKDLSDDRQRKNLCLAGRNRRAVRRLRRAGAGGHGAGRAGQDRFDRRARIGQGRQVDPERRPEEGDRPGRPEGHALRRLPAHDLLGGRPLLASGDARAAEAPAGRVQAAPRAHLFRRACRR